MEAVTLQLNGQVGETALAELEQSIDAAQHRQQPVVVDLSEVTLVDRKAVAYLLEQAGRGVRLINCPVYLSQWLRGGAR